jgi:flagellar biosynthetic protein FlhB
MSGRTLPPSPRRLREARQRGDLPRSVTLSRAGSLLGAISALLWAIDASAFTGFAEEAFSGNAPSAGTLARLAAGIFAVLLGAAVGAFTLGSISGGLLFSPGALGAKGLFRLPGSGAGPYLLRALGLASLSALGLYLVLDWSRGLAFASAYTPGALFARTALGLLLLALKLAGAGLAVGAAEALFGWLWHRRRYRRSVEEYRRDLRDEEGDPVNRRRVVDRIRAGRSGK